MQVNLGVYDGTVAAKYTWIDANGKVLQPGEGGVLVFSDQDVPVAVLAVSEVSDERTINLFLNPVNGVVSECLFGKGDIGFVKGQYEILV